MGGKAIDTSDNNMEHSSSILSQRYYRKVCCFTLGMYVCLQLCTGIIAHFFPGNNVIHSSVFTKNGMLMISGGFIVMIFNQILRINLSNFREDENNNDVGTLCCSYFNYYRFFFLIIGDIWKLGLDLRRWVWVRFVIFNHDKFAFI